MQNGTFQQFLDELRAFESGWDRERYDSGQITDAQLTQWARGAVEDFFPDYSSWGDLTSDEWKEMSYKSMNSLGFVGYQFGEALLIDLGYYVDSFYYGNGAAQNTWDGTWPGKNGVNSFEDFATEGAQEVAIREAFGYNLRVIQNGLAAQGKSLDDFINTTGTYQDGGAMVEVDITLTGLLAAAHLRGGTGVVNLLLNDAVSQDEYGTSILQYMEQFGGFEAPSIENLIKCYEEGKGEECEEPHTPIDPEDPEIPEITVDNATHVIDWNWGKQVVDEDFDPAKDTIYFSRMSADKVFITEEDGNVVISVPTNRQTLTLEGVSFADLDPSLFNAQYKNMMAEVEYHLSGGQMGVLDDPELITEENATHAIEWNWGRKVVDEDFDPSTDTLYIGRMPPSKITIEEVDGNLVISVPSNKQTLTLEGIGFKDLDPKMIYVMNKDVRTDLYQRIADAMDDGDGPDDPHGPHEGMMVMVSLTSESQTVDFDPMMDMVHIEAGVTGDRFDIFEESGDALGQTVRLVVYDESGNVQSTTILQGVGLDDLTLANFSVAEETALNEVVTAINAVISEPGDGTDGYPVVYAPDGTPPAESVGTSEMGGDVYRGSAGGGDIIGFDVAKDQIDVGGTSVHGLIITKSPNGELIIDNPWTNAMKIVQGVDIQDMSIDNFAIVGNEHFRQDIGGVMSWELGVGPRDSDTVYVRSHEYGVSETVKNFDPLTMKLSFLYFGTRERLKVEDTEAGLQISSLPSGQSLTLEGVSKADLIPGLVEFHHDQVIEDNLETPFGFSAEEVTLVSRTSLLTPDAPAGASTDGHQTRPGDFTGANVDYEEPEDEEAGPPDLNQFDTLVFKDDMAEQATFNWGWGKKTAIEGFDVENDAINFGVHEAQHLSVFEHDGNLYVEVLESNGNYTALVGVQAEDLTEANLRAPGWNGVIREGSAFMDQMVELGFDFG